MLTVFIIKPIILIHFFFIWYWWPLSSAQCSLSLYCWILMCCSAFLIFNSFIICIKNKLNKCGHSSFNEFCFNERIIDEYLLEIKRRLKRKGLWEKKFRHILGVVIHVLRPLRLNFAPSVPAAAMSVDVSEKSSALLFAFFVTFSIWARYRK